MPSPWKSKLLGVWHGYWSILAEITSLLLLWECNQHSTGIDPPSYPREWPQLHVAVIGIRVLAKEDVLEWKTPTLSRYERLQNSLAPLTPLGRDSRKHNLSRLYGHFRWFWWLRGTTEDSKRSGSDVTQVSKLCAHAITPILGRYFFNDSHDAYEFPTECTADLLLTIAEHTTVERSSSR